MYMFFSGYNVGLCDLLFQRLFSASKVLSYKVLLSSQDFLLIRVAVDMFYCFVLLCA